MSRDSPLALPAVIVRCAPTPHPVLHCRKEADDALTGGVPGAWWQALMPGIVGGERGVQGSVGSAITAWPRAEPTQRWQRATALLPSWRCANAHLPARLQSLALHWSEAGSVMCAP